MAEAPSSNEGPLGGPYIGPSISRRRAKGAILGPNARGDGREEREGRRVEESVRRDER